MLIKRGRHPELAITDEKVYRERRRFIQLRSGRGRRDRGDCLRNTAASDATARRGPPPPPPRRPPAAAARRDGNGTGRGIVRDAPGER